MAELNTVEYANKGQILDALNRAFAQRFNSLAQYILEAQPYVTPKDEAALAHIREIAEFDRRRAERLADTIDSLGGIPQVSTYDPGAAERNYLALDYLYKFLIDNLRRQIMDYEADLPLMQDCPPAQLAFTILTEGLRTLRGDCTEARNALSISLSKNEF